MVISTGERKNGAGQADYDNHAFTSLSSVVWLLSVLFWDGICVGGRASCIFQMEWTGPVDMFLLLQFCNSATGDRASLVRWVACLLTGVFACRR